MFCYLKFIVLEEFELMKILPFEKEKYIYHIQCYLMFFLLKK